MQHRLEKFQHNEKGFTLLELLVSVVLLAIVVGALLSMFVTSTKTNITSAEVVDEGYMAQKHMEKIYSMTKTKNMSQIKDDLNSAGFYVSYNSSNHTRTFSKQDEGYYVEIRVIDSINTTINNELCKVIVNVYKDTAYTDLLTTMQSVYIIDTPVLP